MRARTNAQKKIWVDQSLYGLNGASTADVTMRLVALTGKNVAVYQDFILRAVTCSEQPLSIDDTEIIIEWEPYDEGTSAATNLEFDLNEYYNFVNSQTDCPITNVSIVDSEGNSPQYIKYTDAVCRRSSDDGWDSSLTTDHGSGLTIEACTQLCYDDTTCVSFSFNPLNGSCVAQLYDSTSDFHPVDNDDGWDCYLKNT